MLTNAELIFSAKISFLQTRLGKSDEVKSRFGILLALQICFRYVLGANLIRYLNSQPQNDPDDVSIIKVAPTGKAAFNIRGNTLHSTFKIPANQGFSYCLTDTD